ncbi:MULTISPECIES: nuclear transport factor 2 family protein [unclassified Crossiella]|uniref:nuclear transport factor 2 family protein n=1 Tax=unclassified Crossiella TaxID=2620835 RepID=UPI001FFECF3A|nr:MULTISPECIES: nuclear transport factor 2 family protein [unclassified Crossiella]MCK2244530.1 nuclear transport factor 2 family protein [Crossiella sp. S99.2]MCK2258161.1 nuclear transport factor 2 family protein [Crossiella sp. S99.1]
MERQQAIAEYAAAWSGNDAETIAAAFARCWAPAGTYTDTVTDTVVGVEGMVQLILGMRAQYPGFTLRPTSALDTHHNVGRFSWLMTSPEPIVAAGVDYGRELPGVDFVEFAPDNRITRIVGFFG